MRARPAWLQAALLCVVSLGSAPARSDDDVCAQAYVETQRLQRAARFRAARQQAVTCGQDTCSATVRTQCSEWLESIERALPTLVIDARDGHGASIASVSVEANGELIAERLNGRALELDPGEYVLRYRYDEQVVEQRTLIRESEKYRRLEVQFVPVPEPVARGLAREPTPPAVPAPVGPTPSLAALGASSGKATSVMAPLPPRAALDRDAAAPIPNASYILGGFGLASLATFVVLASSTYAAERRLRQTCAGACESDQVNSVRSRYLGADVALGVSVASSLAAVVVWRYAPSEPSARRRLSLSPRRVTLEGEF